MPAKLHILVLEDNMLDAELAIQALDQAGYTCQWDCVDTREAFLARLDGHIYDLVISDYNLPMFDGLSAVQLLRQRDPDLPFILVSGTLGEETAIESLKAGATDYVVKSHLARLPPVVARALRERDEQRQRREAEARYRDLFENANDMIYTRDLERLFYVGEWHGRAAHRLYARTAAGNVARSAVRAGISASARGGDLETPGRGGPGCR